MGKGSPRPGFNAEVIVIGAGVAGLSLSERLKAKGISTIVLEARRRIGGRIKSRGYGWGRKPLQIPLGAEFIHWSPETGNAWNRIIDRNDFMVDDIGIDGQTILGDELLHDKHDRPPRSAGMILELEAVIEKHFAAGGGDMDVLSFVRSHPLASVPDDDHLALLQATLANEYGEDMDKMSLQTILEPDSYTLRNYRLREGFGGYIDSLGRSNPVRTGTAVRGVQWETRRVLVKTARGSVLTAEQCAVTVPVGMLQRGIPAFSPGLPDGKMRAISEILPGRVTKVIMKFRKRFWSPQMMFLRGGSQQLSWPPMMHHDPDAPFLSALIGGEEADRLADIGGGEAARIVAHEIMKAHGIENPKGHFVNGTIVAWHKKPFSMTGYSSLAVGAEPDARERLRAPVDDTLFFAGEAASTDHPATVHGARQTGILAAEEIIASRGRA